jgi:small subunit ribosomal protein S2
MAVVTMRQLLEAGVHFGHQTRRWNPKMKRFIFGERNGIYIIDLNQTLQRLEVAYSFVRDMVANGGDVLFIGTKKQSQDPIARAAQQCGMPYVNERWLGGMLTNYQTIALRVKKMQEYERMRSAGDFDAMPKKEALILTRELEKLERNLGGIRDMASLPEAVFIIDIKKEHIAVSEANKMGIPIVAVVDTNCDPDLVQYPIPGNDDAIRSGTLMCHVIAEAVTEGRFVASRRGTIGGPVQGPLNRSFEPARPEPLSPVPAPTAPTAPGQSGAGQVAALADVAPATVQQSGLHGDLPPGGPGPVEPAAPQAQQATPPQAQPVAPYAQQAAAPYAQQAGVPESEVFRVEPGPPVEVVPPVEVAPAGASATAESPGVTAPSGVTGGASEPRAAEAEGTSGGSASASGEGTQGAGELENEGTTGPGQGASGGTAGGAPVPSSAAAEVAAAPEH